LAAPNVWLSPHSAGSSAEAGRRMAVDTAQNILDAFDGKLDPANTFNLAELAAAAGRSV